MTSYDDEEVRESLQEIATAFRVGVDIRDRKFRMKTYKQCFIGCDAVDMMVTAGMAETRNDAVALGRLLASNMNLFEHVTRDHDFSDDYLFFRFIGDHERGALKINQTTGKPMAWQDFLAPTGSNNDRDYSLLPQFPSFFNFEDIQRKDTHVAESVWPLDEYNEEFLNQVHPPDWIDPAPATDGSSNYDLVVIGGGTAGLISAAGSAGVGAKVALIEEHMLGGDCLGVGCVPSKALIHSANLAHSLQGQPEHLADSGITVENVKVDFEKVMERVRRLRAEISHHDSAERYSTELGVEVFIGRGKFTSPRTIEVNERTLNFKRAIIATGAYPVVAPIPGLRELYEQSNSSNASSTEPRPIVMTNETLFNLTRKPERMVVVGAGPIGLEIAQAFQRLGVDVTVLSLSRKILPREDPDISDILQEQMIDDGVDFVLSAVTKKVESTDIVLENGYPELRIAYASKEKDAETGDFELVCDAILVASGRRPNVTGLGLEEAGVKFDTRHGLDVDDKLQTTNPRIFGVGDCCSKFQFTHAADFMARAVIRNAFFFGREKMSKMLIPYATFTCPEVASVGLYPRDLRAQNRPFRVIEKKFEHNDRAKLDGKTVGLVRFRIDAKTDKILGATIIGEGAGNMISEVTLAMQSGTGISALAGVIHPYPTTAEVLRQAGDLYNKARLTSTVKSMLRSVVKLQR